MDKRNDWCNDCGYKRELWQWLTARDVTLLVCDTCWQRRRREAGITVKVGVA